jgi:hypothetical protein
MSQLSDKGITDSVGTLPAHGETINLTTGAAADNTAVLVAGQTYDLICDQHCYVCASATATADDADSTDMLLPAYTIVTFTPQTNLYVSAIQVDTAGTLRVSPRVTANVAV